MASQENFTPHWFGRYALVRLLGTGGMAEVFLARVHGARGFEKIVVLKRILPRLNRHAKYVELFVDEAKRLAQLQHNNIVQVMDFDEYEGWPFLVMEYVHGKDLRQVFCRSRERGIVPTCEFAVYCVTEILKGLVSTHGLKNQDGTTANLLHRDVTPDNVLVSYAGEVKLGDFGVAHLVGQVDPRELRGKLPYSAPEALQNTQVDRRADVFSAGVVLWESLTGINCFEGDTLGQMAQHIRDTPAPPPSLHNAAIPPELDRIVLKAIERDRDKRYDSAQEFDDALVDFIYTHGLRCEQRRISEVMQSLFGEESRPLELPPAPPRPGSPEQPLVPPPVASAPPGQNAHGGTLADDAGRDESSVDGLWLDPDDDSISDLVERITSPLRPVPRLSAIGPALDPARIAALDSSNDWEEVTSVERFNVWFRDRVEPVALDVEQLTSHLAADASAVAGVGTQTRPAIALAQLGHLLYWDSLLDLPIPDEPPLAEASLGDVSVTRLWWSLTVRRLTGLVLLEDGTRSQRRLLVLKEGVPLYVYSNEAQDGALAIAHRRQLFSPSVLYEAVSLVIEQRLFLDQALLKCASIGDPAAAREAVRRAFAAILLMRIRPTLRWSSGRFCIFPDVQRAQHLAWKMPALLSSLLPAVRHSFALSELEQRFGGVDDRAAFVTPRGASLLPALNLNERDRAIVETIDGKRGIAQILSTNRADSEAERLRVLSLLYVLTETNVVEMV